LLKNGIPYDAIDEMEKTDYDDWLAASAALDIEQQIQARHVATYGQPPDKKVHQHRKGELERLEKEREMLLGQNPFQSDPDLIQKSWEKMEKLNGSKRNKSSIKSEG